MNKLRPAAFLFSLLIAACATVSGINRMIQFEPVETAYREAIRWSDFETADRFRKDAQTETGLQELKKLDRIKVTAYEVKQTIVEKDRLHIRQIVEIQYYTTDDMVCLLYTSPSPRD